MKLATVPDGTRDGRLVVVDDREGTRPRRASQTMGIGKRGLYAAPVPSGVAPNLWQALQKWGHVEPQLREIDEELRAGTRHGQEISSQRLMAPLPRTTSFLDGSAFIQHIVLVRKARNAEPPEDLRTVPLMYQGIGDPLLGPADDIPLGDEAWGCDLEAEVAVVLDDVPMGTKANDALGHVKLLVLLNDVSLRNLIPRELAAGFGFFHGKPPSSLGPFAVTPDELGPAWRDGRLHLRIQAHAAGRSLGAPDCGQMFFSFAQLIEHAARTRPLPAGTILGSGTVANDDPAAGSGCLAEVRMLETIRSGKPSTPFLRHGDRVRIEVLDSQGRSVFGAIDQVVAPAR